MRYLDCVLGGHVRGLLIVLLCTVLVLPPAPLHAAAGDLDPIFSGDGKLITRLGSGYGTIYEATLKVDGKIAIVGEFGVAQLLATGELDPTYGEEGIALSAGAHLRTIAARPDGKLVAAGSVAASSVNDIIVMRYNLDGTPDRTFDGDGKVIINFGDDEMANALLLQPDGKIVVAGTAFTGAGYDFVLARYTQNGSPDNTFDSDGKVVINLGGNDSANALVLQSDGKLVAAGQYYTFAIDTFALVRFNYDGSLDQTFDGDGIVLTELGNFDSANALILQPDNKLVAAGLTQAESSSFGIVRYNSDGSLDRSFDNDGILLTVLGTTANTTGLILQPDGKLVVAGTAGTNEGALVRYNPNGSLDTSFSGDGSLVIDLGGDDQLVSLLLQPDGKLIAGGGGIAFNGAVGVAPTLVRVNRDGSLDSTFGGNGIIHYQLGSSELHDLVRQVDGKLVAAGFAYTGNSYDFALARINRDGSLDRTFDGDGKIYTNFGGDDRANALVLQPDGKLIVAGYISIDGMRNFALARYSTDGSLDNSFDGDGKVITDVGGDDWANALVLQPDGKLVAAGISYTPNGFDFALVRYHVNGSLDSSFNGNGKVLSNFGTTGRAFELILQPDGKLVAAGYGSTGAENGFGLMRFNADGSLDSSFDGDGKTVTEFGDTEWVFALALQPDGKYVAAGQATISGSTDFALVRYNGDGSLDRSFDGDGILLTNLGGEDSVRAIVLQANGKLLAAGHAYIGGSNDFALVRYNADGSLDRTFDSDGVRFTDFGGQDYANALVLEPDGKFIAGGAVDGNFALARFLTDEVGLATIRIVQDAIPDNTRNYVYDSAFGAFRLDDTGSLPDDKDGVPNSMSFSVAPGSYGFSQRMVTGWRVSDIRCDRPELASVSMPNRSVTLNVKSGDNVTCTFVTKQAVTVYARAYWDKNASRRYDVNEPWKSGVWTEIFDAAGKQVAANFTDSNGQAGAFNLVPGAYSVCQTPPSGWWNTQPGKLDPRYNKPCHSFNVAPAGLVTGYFGWIDRPVVYSAEVEMEDTGGLEVFPILDADEETFVTNSVYLPMIER